MAKILCVWEFGAGLGHLNRLLPIARRLAAGGHAVTLAVPDPDKVRSADNEAGDGIALRRGHAWPAPSGPDARKAPTHSLADTLALFGYGDAARLAAVAGQWRDLLDAERPDLLVADFAPTLALAANGRWPLVAVGSGFTIPPPGRPLPPLRPWVAQLPESSRATEAEILQAANQVRAAAGGPAVAHLADLFSGDRCFVATLPALDPYAAYRDEAQVPPYNVPHIADPPALQARPDRSALVYLPARHPLLDATLVAVRRTAAEADVYVSGGALACFAQSAPAGIRIHAAPLDLGALLPRVRVAVHHAGLGIAHAALLAGTPQVALPSNLERQVTARGLAGYGSALVVEPRAAADADSLADLLQRSFSEPALQRAAAAAAATLAHGSARDTLQEIVDACAALLRRRAPRGRNRGDPQF
jgi:UDP:flavonoid glycosyltransferase YjiC (YdhE family)